jgi:2-dehydropantoate 2-reductase
MADRQPKILLFGAGAVGIFYLYFLNKVSSVTAVCRSNYDAAKKNGFIVNSSLIGQNLHFSPNVVRDCAEAASSDSTPFDYVVVCSKVIPSTIPKLIAPAITSNHTAIVLAQNGIGIEDEYMEAFPTNPIISCTVYIPATQGPAGVVKHGEIELLEVGSYPSSASSVHAQAFVDLLSSAGATAKHFEDVQPKRFYKLLINASWNPICALTRCTDTDFMESSSLAPEMALAVMLEVCELAKAYGYTISREEAEYQLRRTTSRISSKTGVEPSMLQDVKAGRRLEIESILGNAVRMAKAKGVKCPTIETLYVLAKALDSQLGRA